MRADTGYIWTDVFGEDYRINSAAVKVAKRRCMDIQCAKDIRYGVEKISTHDGYILPAWSCMNLADLRLEAVKYDIDEGQFFPDIVIFCDMIADQGKIVIVATLDGNFQKRRFRG